jgi:hypothetical protein
LSWSRVTARSTFFGNRSRQTDTAEGIGIGISPALFVRGYF